MKIGLLGMSELGIEYLKYLIKNNFSVEFVTGKYKKLAHADTFEVQAKKLCKQHNIPYLGNVDVNSKDMIKAGKTVDVAIIGGYDKILKSDFLQAVKKGVINTHFGLIPENRGCNPSVWAVLYGDIAGYTTYLVNEKIDLGDVIERYEKSSTGMSAKEIYDSLTIVAVKHFPETLEKLQTWKWEKLSLDQKQSCYHKQGMPNGSWVSWEWKYELLNRFTPKSYIPPRTKDLEVLLRRQVRRLRFLYNNL